MHSFEFQSARLTLLRRARLPVNNPRELGYGDALAIYAEVP